MRIYIYATEDEDGFQVRAFHTADSRDYALGEYLMELWKDQELGEESKPNLDGDDFNPIKAFQYLRREPQDSLFVDECELGS